MQILEDIQDGDWKRLEIHARRVRILSLQNLPTTISPYVYTRVRGKQIGPLLPALQELRIPDGNTLDLAGAYLSLDSNLERVEINNSCMNNTTFFRPFMCALREDCPHLRHVILRGTRAINPKSILKFNDLRTLELRLSGTYLSPSFMEALGNLGSLRDLTLHVGSSTPSSVEPPIRPENPEPVSSLAARKFKHLRSLRIVGDVLSIHPLLEFMNLTSLTHFSLEEASPSNGIPTAQFWTNCFSSVSVSAFLETVDIKQHPTRNHGHNGYSLSAFCIHPLLQLQSLSNLVILEASFSMTDSELAGISSAFPTLEKLVLPPVFHDACPTIASVLHLSNNCPQLDELKMCLSLTGNIQQTMLEMSQKIRLIPRDHDHPLRMLCISSAFGRLDHKALIQFAEFLNVVFPRMATLEGYGPKAPNESWSQVYDLHAMLQRRSI